MAANDIEPGEQEKIRKQLNSKLRYFFLAIVGIAILVTGAILFFGESGNLFKGFIGEEPPELPELTFPPTVVSVSPVANATDISTEAGTITVVFDESGLSYDLSTNITILASGSTDNKLSSSISYELKTLTINYSELEGDTQYTVTIPAETITNDTEPMDSDLSWSFTTEEAISPPPAPPEDEPEDEPEEEPEEEPAEEPAEEEEEEIEITDHDVSPETFNPLTNETKISYEISEDAVIEIKIIDHTGITILTLVDDEEVEAGEYYVWWNGTDSTGSGGDVVSAGAYTYKIYAKDPTDEEVQDIKSGEVTALYSQPTEDFEDYTTVTTPTPQPTSAGTTQDSAATVALQNAEAGVTAGTGTPALIYLLFPLGGLFLHRKKK